jgi:hypothetical protein
LENLKKFELYENFQGVDLHFDSFMTEIFAVDNLFDDD